MSGWAPLVARLRRVLGIESRNGRSDAALELIRQSKLFDSEWYAQRYPDIIAAGCDPLVHFVEHGASEGRNPSERFDLRWYVRRNADVARSGINPLLHYLEYGRAEGRSIRSVGSNGSGDPDDEPTAHAKDKAATLKAAAKPYPSDFKPIWRARPVNWSNLFPGEDEGRFSIAVNATGVSRSIIDWLVQQLALGGLETEANSRLQWFFASNGYCNDQRIAPVKLNPEAVRQIVAQHGLGLEAIVDGWFAGFERLVLRLAPPAAPAKRVHAFQFDLSGRLVCCGEAGVHAEKQSFIRLDLDHELLPVLLAWTDGADGLEACTVIPFPSLFRGGLHHSEIMMVGATEGAKTPLVNYSTELALDLSDGSDPEDHFAIGRLEVDLACATGTEPLFRPGVVDVLATQYGIALHAHSHGTGAARLLAKCFDVDFPSKAKMLRNASQGLLVLPADGFPTLRLLVARVNGRPLGAQSFCVAKAADRQPEAFVCLPRILPELSAFTHPALPSAHAVRVPSVSEPWPSFGFPTIIRFRDERVWKSDPLMPVSLDVPMPLHRESQTVIERTGSTASVVIDQSGDGGNLPLLLASLDLQGIADLEILLPDAMNGQNGGSSVGFQCNRAASEASGDYLVFVNAGVSLPDPRTLNTLLALAGRSGVAAVSCNLVCEDKIDGRLMVRSSAVLSQVNGIAGEVEWIPQRFDAQGLVPSAVYPVVANDMWLCVISRAVWQKLGGFSEGAPTVHLMTMDFADRARAQGLSSVCTALVSAAISQDAISTDTARGMADTPRLAALDRAFAEQVTSFWRLGR